MSDYHINRILEEKKITDFLQEMGILPVKKSGDRVIYRCPIHSGDNDPSFIVYPVGTKGRNYQTYHCFACIEENELIWTSKGLEKIVDIKIGDKVLDIYGEFSKVSKIKASENYISSLKLGCFSDPLYLTSDHICIYILREDAPKVFPYIRRNKDIIFFDNKCKNKKRTKKYQDELKKINFREDKLEKLKEGDFLVFPVIDEQKRDNRCLINKSILKKYNRGPRNKRIEGFCANKNAAFIIGIWLAEGSICSNGRVVRWTFNINEKEIAERLSMALWEEFALMTQYREYPLRNTCEIDCCNVDLAKQCIYWLGKGAGQKKIPVEILSWTKNLQAELIDSFVLGDGCKSGRQCYTISQKLAYSLFCLSVQSGKLPYLTPRESRVDKDGVNHKRSYCVGFSSKERMNGFYETIKGVVYYISKIKKIKKHNEKKKVIDIEVEKSHSFVTKMGAVHNCHSGINIINLKSDLDGISTKEAISFFLKDITIDSDDFVDSIISDNQDEKDLIENSKQIEILLLSINTICKKYLLEYGDEDEVEFFENKLYRKIDSIARAKDVDTLEACYDILIEKKVLEQRAEDLCKRRDNEEASSVKWIM